jgi:hypothetical protein
VLLLIPLALACGQGESRPADSGRPVVTEIAEIDTALAPPGGCRREGLWQWCAVLDRMERAGVILTPTTDVPPGDLLRGERRTFQVGAGEDALHVYLYPSVPDRQRDTDALDSALVAPRGERRSYVVQPLLVTSNNLAALVITPNERTRERLALALSAGLPQPPR